MKIGICRDCGDRVADGASRCQACGSRRLLRHPELHALTIAHIDCDAFYATVEKRDDPSLLDKPVIVGGGKRGVVAACCYIARLHGVRSAMPMFKALERCPKAVVIRPDMRKYRSVGLQVRALMQDVTPLVEPLSIDEAFLDLSGTQKLHGGSPAQTLARLVRRIEAEIGITASIGLSYNKFLAKIASELDKPRGFAVIGQDEALGFLESKPVGLIWGVGTALERTLNGDGIRTIGQLRLFDETELVRRYGTIGKRLLRFANGEDFRKVDPDEPVKSISAETTFETDIAQRDRLLEALWPLCETVARRLKAKAIGGRTVTLKLKTTDFRLRTRSRRLGGATQLADVLFRAGAALLEAEADGTPFRLIGIGCSEFVDAADADRPDLLDPGLARRALVERTMDALRAKLGDKAVMKGRTLGVPSKHPKTGPRRPES